MYEDATTIDEFKANATAEGRLPHPAEVAVSLRAGTATLRGTVGSFHQRRAAIDAAASVRGVRSVQDELLVDPRDRWEDNEIRGVALQALICSRAVPDERIDVTVADAWLTLKGEVKHQQHSDAAFETVKRVPGVGGITNRIVVVRAPEPAAEPPRQRRSRRTRDDESPVPRRLSGRTD